jgi:hypothetical protein
MRATFLLAALLIVPAVLLAAPSASASPPLPPTGCSTSNTHVNTHPYVYYTPSDGVIHIRGEAWEICGQETYWYADI